MTRILAIDPGPEQSAVLEYDTLTRTPVEWVKHSNDWILDLLDASGANELAIEMVASYGMAVGAEVFQTCVWVGRFTERWLEVDRPVPRMVFRKEVKMHLCGSMRAKDANVRQALIDRYGPGKDKAIGRKATPGPLYGMAGDCWSALAVAITAHETRALEQAA